MLGLARSGATVYASYFAGTGKEQNGPWMPWMDQVFGIEHNLRYGLADLIEDEEVTFELVKPLGDLPTGARLRFPAAGQWPARAYLPVQPISAEVLAVDGHGRPALLRNADGDGSMVLCTYPLEHMAACRPGANPEPTWQLYSALATAAGVSRPVRVEDPRVVVGRLHVGQSDAFLALNISPEALDVGLVAPGKSVHLAGGTAKIAVATLALAPYDVAVLYTD